MDSETEQNIVTLREYFEALLAEKDKQLDARFVAMNATNDLARVNIERRLENLNELRREVIEDRSRFLTIEIYDAKEAERQVWRDLVNRQITTIQVRNLTWTAAIGVALIVITILINWLGRR